MDLGRIRKALVAAAAAALVTLGAGLADGQDWPAALGMAVASALIAGGGTYAVPNRLSARELSRLAELAAERERQRPYPS